MTQMTLTQAFAAQTQEFPSWEEMSDVEQLHSIWWDAYKDAYGFRPRGQDVGHWTVEDFQKELDILGAAIDRAEKARLEEEALAVVRFSKRVQEVINTGAGDRETALRWIHEADGSQGDNEFLCYLNGLPYGFFKNF
jgi:hypothetical protein